MVEAGEPHEATAKHIAVGSDVDWLGLPDSWRGGEKMVLLGIRFV